MLRRLACCVGMIGAGAACGGTEEEPCRLPECLSTWVQVALVDEAGESVSARGQLRSNESQAPRRFDCSEDQSTPDLGARCVDGSLSLYSYPGATLEVRFAFADNSFGDWQTLETEVTVRQVGEPGCSSPCLSAMSRAVVPEGARLSPGGG
jgi:hypothetical protein